MMQQQQQQTKIFVLPSVKFNLVLYQKQRVYSKKTLNSCFSYCFLQNSWYNQEVIGSNQEVRPEILGFVLGKVSVTGL